MSVVFKIPGFVLACENIRFSSLFAAGDVSCETSPAAKSVEKQMFSQARFLCMRFLPFFPTPSPLFYSRHFRAVLDSRYSFFAPKPHGNACYAGYRSPGSKQSKQGEF